MVYERESIFSQQSNVLPSGDEVECHHRRSSSLYGSSICDEESIIDEYSQERLQTISLTQDEDLIRSRLSRLRHSNTLTEAIESIKALYLQVRIKPGKYVAKTIERMNGVGAILLSLERW